MNTNLKLLFVLAGGAEVGLGHIMRAAAIASLARRWGWRVEARIEGDESAHATWHRATSGSPSSDWGESAREDDHDLLIIDTPLEKERWIEAGRSRSIPTVLLDDASQVGQVALTIQPNLHDRPVDLPNHLSGPRFSILSAAHRIYAGLPSRSKTRFLVTLGGADPHDATAKMIPRITQALERSPAAREFDHLDVVLGAAYAGSFTVESETHWANLGWTVHRALSPDAMARLMSESRLAVTGFGTSQTELAWHATPYLSVAHYAHDERVASRLEAQGIGRSLGWAETLDLEHADQILASSLTDSEWRAESASRGFAAVAGARGVERILTRLERLALLTRAQSSQSERTVRVKRLGRKTARAKRRPSLLVDRPQ